MQRDNFGTISASYEVSQAQKALLLLSTSSEEHCANLPVLTRMSFKSTKTLINAEDRPGSRWEALQEGTFRGAWEIEFEGPLRKASKPP